MQITSENIHEFKADLQRVFDEFIVTSEKIPSSKEAILDEIWKLRKRQNELLDIPNKIKGYEDSADRLIEVSTNMYERFGSSSSMTNFQRDEWDLYFEDAAKYRTLVQDLEKK